MESIPNSIAATTSINALDGNTIDLSVTDGNTNVTETFTQICGDQLLNVQYAPSEPTVSVSDSIGVTTHDSGAAVLMVINPIAVTPITTDNEGQYVLITTCSNADLVGQVRRITTRTATTLTVENGFVDAAGAVLAAPPYVPAGTTFKVIRAAIGPFIVKSYDSVNKRILTTSVVADQPSVYVAGDPTFYPTDAGSRGRYGDPQNGPCYVHVTSGAGAGQIRRIVDATGVTNPGAGEVEIEVTEAFSVNPDVNSKFVFINAVPRNATGTVNAPTATGGAGTGEGAYGVINGASGLANALRLYLRPGYGEPTTGGTTTVDIGDAGIVANNINQWAITLNATTNVQALVHAINLGTAPGMVAGSGIETGHWKAEVGPGRDGTLPTTRFDFGTDDKTNNATGLLPDGTTSDGIDCLCDFQSTSPPGNGTFNSVPKRFHRFVDNVSLLWIQ